MANNNADVDLLAGLGIDSSEAEILKGVKIIQNWLKTRADAKLKLDIEIDETVINNTINKLQNILKNKNLRVETQDSIQAITKEANAMLDVVNSAKKATQEKLEFAKANKKVKDSADDTADAINRERNSMNSLDDIDDIMQNINMNARQGGSVFQQFGATLRDAFSTYTVANLLQDAIYKVVDTGKEALDTVKKFDDINVDLQMATGEDKDYVKGLISDYAELGGELGALTETVAESADTFLRQGRSMEETNQLISDAIVLSKVAKTEGEKASEILTATINGFQLAATEGSRVNDIISSIDMNSAVSAEGIGTALTKVASMAHSAGISLEKTAAIAAVLKQTTMDADQTIGTSMKTMLSRMNAIRAGKFVDEETGEALNDVEKVLNKIGITMRNKVTGQFKEAEVIIDEVGKKWATFDENSKKAAQFALGGAYQANKVVALFDNYDKVIELTKIAEESAGTALQKFNDSYLPSLEAKANALKSSLQSLATTTISDEFYGSVLDSTKAIVDMTTETGILKGALTGLATAGAVYTFQHLTTYLHDATQEFANLGEAMQITRGATGTITDIQRLIDLTSGLSESQTRLLLNTRNLTDAQRTAILVNQYLAQGMDDDLARATAEATLQTWGLTTAQNAATGAGITLRNTLRGIAASLMSNPLILVSAAVTVGVTAFNKYKQAQEETIRATKEAAEEANTLGDEISELATKYIQLSDAVKTDVSVKEDLVSTQTELIKKLGLESDEVDNLITKYGSLSEAIKRVSVDKLRESQIDLIAGLNVAKDELLKAGDSGFFKDKNIINATGEDAVKAFQELEKVGIVDKGSYTSRGGALVLTGDDETVEGVLENYKQLGDALKALRNKFTSDELSENTLYQNIHKRYEEIKDEAESYESIIENINENLAQQMTFVALYDKELPNTKDAFEGFRSELLETAIASEEFIGSEQTIENVLDAYLATLPEFEKFYSDLSEIQNSTPDSSDTTFISDKQIEKLKEYQFALSKLSSALADLNNLNSSDILDLLTDFSSYGSIFESFGVNEFGEGDIKGAIEAVAKKIKDEVSTKVPELQSYIEDMYKTILNPFGDSAQLESEIFELQDILAKVRNGEQIDNISELIVKYDDLEGSVVKLTEGYSLEEDAVISLLNARIESANKAIAWDIQETETEIANVKARIAARKLEEREFNKSGKSLVYLDENGKTVKYNPFADAYLEDYKTLEELNERVDTLYAQMDEPLEKSSSSSKDFSESIDWASQSIGVLERNLSKLETVLNNTKGWESQLKVIEKLIEARKELKSGYEQTKDVYYDEYKDSLNKGILATEGISDIVKNNIESGDLFDVVSIEDFIEENVSTDSESIREKIYDAIQESIKWYNEYSNASDNVIELEFDIISDIEKAIDIQKDAMKDLVDEYKEALSVQKDLYDYQKRTSDQTKNIAQLEKQLSVYANDNSEEGKATAQKLRVQLDEAKSELEDTQYEKHISDQETMLDNLYAQYEQNLDDYLAKLSDEVTNKLGILDESIVNTDRTIDEKVTSLEGTLGTESDALSEGISGNLGTALSTENKKVTGSLETVDESIKAETGVISGFTSSFTENITSLLSQAKDFGTTLSGIFNKMDELVVETKEEAKRESAEKSKDVKALGFQSPLKNLSSKEEILITRGDIEEILKRLSSGSKPLLSDRLVEFANNSRNVATNVNVSTPDYSKMANKVVSGDVQVVIENMNLPNVTNPTEFANQVGNAIKSNSKVQKIIRGVSVDLLAGSSVLKVQSY